MDEDIEVNIKRNKRKLEKIRSDRQDRQFSRDNSTATSERVQTATGRDQRDTYSLEGPGGDTEGRDNRTEEFPPVTGRSDSGIRSALTAYEYPTESADRGIQQARADTLTVEDAEAKAERERELTRQRVQRYRDRQREEASNQAQNHDSNVTGATPAGNDRFSFNLKKGNAEPVKLLSKAEADDGREALIYVYLKGSSLIDDAIEIVTAGHEAVSIWAMSEDEATLFAEAHLKKAQKDKSAARSARLLLRIHDKLFLTQYVASRTIATSRHIKSSGGISFK